MSDLVQQLLAFGLVALAAAWLLRRAWRRRSSSVCDECPKCAAAAKTASGPLVQIDERREV